MMSEPKSELLHLMASGVEECLETFDESTGRFITEPTGPIAPGARPEDLGWAVTNQDVMYALATLYIEPGSPHHGDARILEIAGRAGDAVRDAQDEQGRVEFIKPDGSKWGMSYMCWTNYAWLETWALLREHLDDGRRLRWEEGLTLAHEGQADEVRNAGRVHNIPCWKSMSCWRAGELMGREDWQRPAEDYMAQCVEAQDPAGYWPEHGGPTTGYNRVYVHAMGLYHIFSGDESVLPAIEAATDFHQTFTYPDGSDVETIDGRVKYGAGIHPGGLVSMTLVPRGRRYARYLLELPGFAEDLRNPVTSHLASLYHYMRDGDEAPINLDEASFTKQYHDWAIVKRDGPWFGCLSAFVCPPSTSRWGQDRQQFVSLWHQDAGLLIGGGNSRNQPEWSTFVAGGRYVPDSGAVADDGVALDYGDVRCGLSLELDGDAAVIRATAEGSSAVNHLVLRVGRGERLVTDSGRDVTIGEESLRWSGREMGRWLEVRGFRILPPPGADLLWPSAPFNPYAIDGAPPHGSEAAVLSAPVDGEPVQWRIQPAGE